MEERKTFNSIGLNETANIQCRINDITEMSTSSNGTYCALSLSDGEEELKSCKYWDRKLSDLEKWKGQAATVTLKHDVYRDKPSWLIRGISAPNPGVTGRDFIIKSDINGEASYDAILKMVKKACGEGPDKEFYLLTEALYSANREKLLYWSAAKSIHHNYYGGLLYHTCRMVYAANGLCNIYPKDVNRGLVLCGAALHDIGKLIELETDEAGSAVYTVEGNLHGHGNLGRDMVLEEYFRVPGQYTRERIEAVRHLIACHHGKREWGASELPMTKEGYILFLVDYLDSRMEILEQAYKKLQPGEMSEDIFGLDGKAYKWPFAGN